MRTVQIAALFLSSLSLASSIVPHTLKDRVRTADRVVLAQVVSSQTVAADGDPRKLKTISKVLIGEDLKGTGPREVEVVQLGGSLNGWQATVPGDAHLEPGETAFLFLRCTGARCCLVALGEGRLQIKGDRAVVHDLFTDQWDRRPVASVRAEILEASR